MLWYEKKGLQLSLHVALIFLLNNNLAYYSIKPHSSNPISFMFSSNIILVNITVTVFKLFAYGGSWLNLTKNARPLRENRLL